MAPSKRLLHLIAAACEPATPAPKPPPPSLSLVIVPSRDFIAVYEESTTRNIWRRYPATGLTGWTALDVAGVLIYEGHRVTVQ